MKKIVTIICMLFTNFIQAQTTITASNFQFTPTEVTINLGEKIIFYFAGGSHNIVSTNNPNNADSWTSGFIAPGSSFTYIPTVSGNYTYVCNPHVAKNMVGTFTVLNSSVTAIKYFSKAETINQEEESISIFPNPAKDRIFVSTRDVKTSSLQLLVYDLNQKLLYSKNFEQKICKSEKGITCMCPGISEFNINHLAQGIYLVKVIDGKKTLAVKKVIME